MLPGIPLQMAEPPLLPADPGEDHDTETLLREPVRGQPAGGALLVRPGKPHVSVRLPSWGPIDGLQPSLFSRSARLPLSGPSGKTPARAHCGCGLTPWAQPALKCYLSQGNSSQSESTAVAQKQGCLMVGCWAPGRVTKPVSRDPM